MTKFKKFISKKKVSLKKAPKEQWVVYLLLCNDDSIYTGITNHLERRIEEHNDDSPKSKAARYTRARQPVKIVFYEQCENRIEASKREYAIKRLTRAKKESLVLNAK